MDLKLKRNRAVHLNAKNGKVNSHCTWTYGERHCHMRIMPGLISVASGRKKDGKGYFSPNIDTILTQLNLNEKIHKNNKREGEVFTGDRKKDKIEE